MEQEYIITVFSENKVGLLSQITTVFTCRDVNIESLTTSESALQGIHKFTIVVRTTPDQVDKLVRQVEKKIDVLKTFVYTPDEVVQQEIALYKVTRSRGVEQLVREHNVRILEIDEDYIVVEKTGHKADTQALFRLLQPYGVQQFVRSGTVAIRNFDAWRNVRLNMDTIHENFEPDTSLELFGRKFKYPFFAGPVGAMTLHYGDKYNDLQYNEILVAACAAAGSPCFCSCSSEISIGEIFSISIIELGSSCSAASIPASIPASLPATYTVTLRTEANCSDSGSFSSSTSAFSTENPASAATRTASLDASASYWLKTIFLRCTSISSISRFSSPASFSNERDVNR